MPTMSMSPEIQNAGQLPSAEQAQEIFKQRFSEMSYNVMMAKFPELASRVVTFKIIETDAETGKGVGAFVLLLEDKTIYLPVVMIDSQLKPFDMFYFKDLNIFLPLSNDWLDEVSKSSLTNLGEPVKMPHGVNRDMSVRDLIIPPIMPEGRIGLASDMSEMFKAASYDPKPRFLEFIKNASEVMLNGIQLSFKRNPNFGQKVAQFYGKSALIEAFQIGHQRAKKASLEKKAAFVQVVTAATVRESLPKIKELCGEKVASDVFKAIATNDIAAVDTRPVIKNTITKIETTVKLTPATTAGFYNLYFPDKDKQLCLVVPAEGSDDYVVLYADGSKAWSVYKTEGRTLMGEPVCDDKVIKETAVYKALASRSKNRPITGKYNVPLYVTEKGFIQALTPQFVDRIVENEDGSVTFNRGHIDSDDSRGKIRTAFREPYKAFYPKSTTWFSVPEPCESKKTPIDDPQIITRWIDQYLSDKTDTAGINVKKAGYCQWWVNREPGALYLDQAITKVATLYDLSLLDAAQVLNDATNNGTCNLRLVKKAAGGPPTNQAQPPQGQPQQAQPPQGMMGQDPNMMGQDPNMMGQDPTMMGAIGMPAQVPTLSPTDLAIAETIQSLQQENQLRMQQIQDQQQQQQAQMQQEAESNEKLISILSRIQERSSAIGSATNGMVPPEAMQSPLAAGQMLAPEPPPQPEPPPMPVMNEETPSSEEMVASQIHPELAEQAADLHDKGMFDTSVLSVMAAAPLMREVVSTYIPNLEKALDNLGRIQLTLWISEPDTKAAIGNDSFVLIENKLRSVFKGLGEVVLQINRNALDKEENVSPSQRTLGDQQ